MVQRAPSARDGVPFHVTPLLLTTLIAAIVATVLLAVLWYVDTSQTPLPPAPLGRGGPPPSPPSHAATSVAVGVFAIAWVAVIIAACRDQILRRIDQVAERVAAATIEFAESREEEGVFRGMRIATQHDPGPPGPGPGGHVVPFPRQTPPPSSDD